MIDLASELDNRPPHRAALVLSTRGIAALLLLLFNALWLSIASAQQPPTQEQKSAREQAREFGRKGLAELDAKRYGEAEAQLSAAIDLYPAPTLYVARSHARSAQGKLLSAAADLRTVQNMPPVAGEPAAYTAARTTAKAELPAVEARFGQLVVTVNDPSSEVKVNGTTWPAHVMGQPVPVDPGLYRAEASHAQGPRRAEAQVSEGQTVRLHVELPLGPLPLPGAEVQATSAAQPQPAQPVPPNSERAATALLPGAPPSHAKPDGGPGAGAYLVGTLTLATAVATGITGVLYMEKKSEYEDVNGNVPANEAEQLRSDAETMGWIATGLGAATLVGIAASLFLFLDSDSGAAPAGPSVHARFGLGSAALVGTF